MYLLALWSSQRPQINGNPAEMEFTKNNQDALKDRWFYSGAENIYGVSRKYYARKQETQKKKKILMSLCQKDTGALMKGFQLAKDG